MHEDAPTHRVHPSAHPGAALFAGLSTLMVFFLAIYIQLPSHRPTGEQLSVSLPPLQENLFKTAAQKRLYSPLSAQTDLNGSPDRLLATLQAISDDQLLGLRCTGRVAHEDGMYFLRAPHTHAALTHVTDERLLRLLTDATASVKKPDTMLTAQICEAETGDLLLEYTTGQVTYHHPDEGQHTATYLTKVHPDGAFSPGVRLVSHELWPYPGCRMPMAMTDSEIVYYECGFTSAADVHSTYHQVDFTKSTSDEIAKCLYTYTGGPKKTCTEE